MILISSFLMMPAFGQEIIQAKQTIEIEINTFRNFDRIKRNLENNSQPLASKDDIKEFLNAIVNRYTLTSDFNTWLSSKLDFADPKNAILFLQHPLDLNALSPELSEDKKTDLKNRYKELCDLTNSIKNVVSELESIQIPTGMPGDEEGQSRALNRRKLLIETLALHKATISDNEKILANLRTEYTNSFPVFKEDVEKTEQFILHKERNEWADYLLHTDEILIVILGGKKDIANSDIRIENGASAFEASLNDLKELAGGLGVIDPMSLSLRSSEQQACDLIAPDLTKETISCTFIRIKNSHIKPPSKVIVSNDKLKDGKIVLDIHEKSFLEFKVGISANYVDRKNLTLDDQNNLTIAIDENQKKEFTDNFLVLLEITPWGKDVDRIESVWSGKRQHPNFTINRFGFVVGFKLSKDPLQTLIPIGLSYTLSREFSLVGGLSYVSVPKNVEDLNVGANQSLSYLEENVDREYVPSWFFGLAISPRIVSKALKSKKE
jgi:hypothetical protein